MSSETYSQHQDLLTRTTTTHTTYDQSLSSFAPEILKHILSQEKKIKVPYVKTFEAVGFFADVSGFTKATESLSNAMGDLGTEILAHKINAYLPHIAKKIVGSGGDVVKFAGDALLCIWPPPPSTITNEFENEFKKLEKKWRKYQNRTDKEKRESSSTANLRINEINSQFEAIKKKYMSKKFQNEMKQKEHVKKNAAAAIQCALEIQDQFGSMDLSGSYYDMYPKKTNSKKRRTKKAKNEKIEFRVKCGIGIGKIHLLIVGGALERCEYLICGDGLIQAFDCENDCDPAESRMVVVSERMRKLDGIEDNFLLKRVIKEDKKKKGKKSESEQIKNYEVLGVNKKNKKRTRIDRRNYGHLVPDASNGLSEKLANYLPAAVKPHLDMPQQIWTGELREVTILFISLPWNARSFAKFTNNILSALQDIIYVLQSVIYKYQGSLNKFLIDDKGSTVMCVFGLPPVAHQNDSARAVLAALELREKISKKKQPAAIGVSCGTVFVGIIGSKGVRREYGILGDKVNLSARLMGLSKKNPVKMGEVVVDDSVYIRSKKEVRIGWKDLGWIWVKGKMDKVHIWRPAQNNITLSAHKIGQAVYLETSDKLSLKEINSEIEIFKKSKDSKEYKGRVIMIEGEVGIGKSSLLGQVQVRNASSIWFLWGKASEFHECYDVDYIVWRQILLGFTSRYSLINNKNRYLFSKYVKERRADLMDWAFLMNDLIDLGDGQLLESNFLGIEYSEENKKKYQSVKEGVRDKYRHDLVFILLEWTARIKPIAIIIDEIEYLTKKDWQITRRLAGLVKAKILNNVLIFLGATPIDNQRYRPLFKKDKLIQKFTELRVKYSDRVIVPCPWGLNKTKFFVKKFFDIGDCSSRIVESIHSACGGRPGFVEHFLSELTAESNGGNYIHVFDKKYLNDKNKHKHIENKKYNGSYLHRPNGSYMHQSNRNQMYASFNPEIDERMAIGLDVTFPIPAYIMSITLSHCDKLKAEQAFILKIASVICKSKGNNSIRFEEHMLRGCHPLAETGMNNKKRLRATLDGLCAMKLIFKSDPSSPHLSIYNDDTDDIGVDINAASVNKKTLKKKPSYNNFDQLPTPSESELSVSGSITKEATMSNFYCDETEFDGITDPMPATKALLQEPAKSVPYRRGKMFKRGINFINMSETERIFVFKHRTLYWIKDENEEYPRSRIKFDQSVQKLKREDQRSCSIKTPRKEYILRCSKKKDMDQWFQLFTAALNANFLSDSMMKRMRNHRETHNKKPPTSPPPLVPQAKRESKKYKERVSKIQNIGGLTSASMQLNGGNTLSTATTNNYSVRITKPENAKPTMSSLLNGLNDVNSPTSSKNNLTPTEPEEEEVEKESATKPKKGVRFGDEEPEDDEQDDDEDFDEENWAEINADIAKMVDNFSQKNLVKDVENEQSESINDNKENSDQSKEDDEEVDDKIIEAQISPQLRMLSGSFVEIKDADDDDDDENKDAEESEDEDREVIGQQPDDNLYEFAYGFLRDVVYQQMLHNQRKQLHTNALKYIAKCLKDKMDDKLALLHTRHIECIQKYSDMLQGDDSQRGAHQPKRQSFFGKRAR